MRATFLDLNSDQSRGVFCAVQWLGTRGYKNSAQFVRSAATVVAIW